MLIPLNIQESGAGPNLVLIHGWAMNNLVWQHWLAQLEKSYRVFCVELPGHGESQYNEYWTLNELLESMAAQLPSHCNMLGWSLGGTIALAYTSEYPKRVKNLVLLASSAKFVQSAGWQYAQSKEVIDTFSSSLLKKPQITIKRFLKLQADGDEHAKEIKNFLGSIIKKSDDLSLKGLVSGLDILCQSDLRDLLKTVVSPVMMLLGEKDQLVPVEVGQQSQGINSHVELCVIKGAAHVPFLSYPNEVSHVLEQFLCGSKC